MRFTSKTEDKKTLLDLLIEKTGASATKARTLIKNSAVFVDGRPALRPDLLVRPGQSVEVTGKKDRKAKRAPSATVLYEDKFIIAAQKPAGVLSISTKAESINTFYRAVSAYVKDNSAGKDKIFIVHRLDREVSGVMMFAKDQEVKKALQDSWDKAEKVYNAVVEGLPPKKEGTVTGWLCEVGENLMRSCPAPAAGDKASRAKLAVTHYRLIAESRGLGLIEVRLETGRKHQIRVHLRDMGCPVIGDRKYGVFVLPGQKAGGENKKGPAASFYQGFKRMGLHAARLSFIHPVTGRKVVIESPVPKSFMLPFKDLK